MLEGYVTKKPRTPRRRRRRQHNTTTSAEVGWLAVQFNEPRHCRDPLFGHIPPNVELLSAERMSERPNSRMATRANEQPTEWASDRPSEQTNKLTLRSCISALNCCCRWSSLQLLLLQFASHCFNFLVWSSFELAVGQRHRNLRRTTACLWAWPQRGGLAGAGQQGLGRGWGNSHCNTATLWLKCVQGNLWQCSIFERFGIGPENCIS